MLLACNNYYGYDNWFKYFYNNLNKFKLAWIFLYLIQDYFSSTNKMRIPEDVTQTYLIGLGSYTIVAPPSAHNQDPELNFYIEICR